MGKANERVRLLKAGGSLPAIGLPGNVLHSEHTPLVVRLVDCLHGILRIRDVLVLHAAHTEGRLQLSSLLLSPKISIIMATVDWFWSR